MNKNEQIPIRKKETPEERDRRISKEVKDIMREEAGRATRLAESSKKPSLDYYDNRREKGEGGEDIHYQGRYGKFKK